MTNNYGNDSYGAGNMVVIPDGNGDNPTIVVLGKVLSGTFVNQDGSWTQWSRGDKRKDGPLPDLLDKAGVHFPDNATAVAWLLDNDLDGGLFS
jgi:hypothetical protein